ncbi:hypothetical protein C8J57DRAFT_1532257 [Mycena rebaudengoi]|nr:hypothetical protein C8J57DRAFT_1532257 [Mycena rebaudengoi]
MSLDDASSKVPPDPIPRSRCVFLFIVWATTVVRCARRLPPTPSFQRLLSTTPRHRFDPAAQMKPLAISFRSRVFARLTTGSSIGRSAATDWRMRVASSPLARIQRAPLPAVLSVRASGGSYVVRRDSAYGCRIQMTEIGPTLAHPSYLLFVRHMPMP